MLLLAGNLRAEQISETLLTRQGQQDEKCRDLQLISDTGSPRRPLSSSCQQGCDAEVVDEPWFGFVLSSAWRLQLERGRSDTRSSPAWSFTPSKPAGRSTFVLQPCSSCSEMLQPFEAVGGFPPESQGEEASLRAQRLTRCSEM